MKKQPESLGALLRDWRHRRSLSQLALATEAGVSQRHLSFIESGRSGPSRAMLLRLAEHLSVPLRERNTLLVAGGFAPAFSERTLGDPELAPARRAVEMILTGHEPFPALAVDRHWTLIHANAAVGEFLAGVDRALLEPPVNVLRLSLHPKGLANRIVNLRQWRDHVLHRLRSQIDVSADRELTALRDELHSYPVAADRHHFRPGETSKLAGIAVPFIFSTEDRVLSFISTTTVFGTPIDITLAELAIESFFPADEATAGHLIREREKAGQI